jgi:hypothetical protein
MKWRIRRDVRHVDRDRRMIEKENLPRPAPADGNSAEVNLGRHDGELRRLAEADQPNRRRRSGIRVHRHRRAAPAQRGRYEPQSDCADLARIEDLVVRAARSRCVNHEVGRPGREVEDRQRLRPSSSRVAHPYSPESAGLSGRTQEANAEAQAAGAGPERERSRARRRDIDQPGNGQRHCDAERCPKKTLSASATHSPLVSATLVASNLLSRHVGHSSRGPRPGPPSPARRNQVDPALTPGPSR